MSATLLPLDKMTRVEKLQAMEELWQDLTQDADSYESPEWHGRLLRETEERYRAGLEVPVDWEIAKQQLLEYTSKK